MPGPEPKPKPAPPAPAPKPAPAPAPVSPPAPKPMRASAVAVPVEPAHSALEREADAVAAAVVAEQPVPSVRAGAQVAGARRAAAAAGAETAQQAPTAQRELANPRGGGVMPEPTRRTLEQRMGSDLSGVRVHGGDDAAQAARELRARAFTQGQDVWLGAGESADDLGLMAHEATHVVQGGEAVMRNGGAGGGAAAAPAPMTQDEAEARTTGPWRYARRVGGRAAAITFDTLPIPSFKNSGTRRTKWLARKAGGVGPAGLAYKANYQRGEPGQRETWRNEVLKPGIVQRLRDAVAAASGPLPADPGARVFKMNLAGGVEAIYLGTEEQAARELTTPTWNRRSRVEFYDVDHIVELQAAYWSVDPSANRIDNMELLDSEVNQASGRAIKAAIDAKVNTFNTDTRGMVSDSADVTKDRCNLFFEDISGGASIAAGEDKSWSRTEIEAAEHLPLKRSRAGNGLEVVALSTIGDGNHVRLLGREGGGLAKRFAWRPRAGDAEAVAVHDDSERDWLRPYVITHKLFHTQPGGTGEFGRLTIRIPESSKLFQHTEGGDVLIERVGEAQFVGLLNRGALAHHIREGLNFEALSPIELDSMSVEADGIVADGRVAPSIPFLRNADIRFSIRAGEAQIFKVFQAPELPVPPPLTIDDASLTLFASDGRGFGVDGNLAFSIGRLGRGQITAAAATGAPITFSGRFDFDTQYFDPARVAFTYNVSSNQWSASGDIGLKPNLVPGIESANGHVAYDGTTLAGNLTVVPKLRAIQQGTLSFTHSEAEGSVFRGTLTLADSIPNLRGGELQASFSRGPADADWRFAAHAELQSTLAGFNQRLMVDYDHGAFAVEGGGDFRRGMLAGNVTIGATNCAVDDAGNRGTEPTDTVTAYGTGQVTVTITPWLQASGRIRLLPSGEVELFGELSLPSVFTVFDERSYQRRLFSMSVDIPIFGVAFAGQRIGIFASIGGNLTLNAGVGPGQLRDARLSITYNPSHEQNTVLAGGARFVVPAHAGLRVAVRGSVGAGIPIVSAEVGLEAGGELGLQAEAAVDAHVDWTPSTGLVLEAPVSVIVEPKFKFDLTGFAEVTADLLLTEVELYSKRWNLAQFELGSALRFGLEFPLRYEEGRPFDISWDQVNFITPEVDVGDMIGQLFERIA